MSLKEQMTRIFGTPSYRRDADYSKEIPQDAIFGTFLFYRDFVEQNYSSDWIFDVLRQLTHAHLSIRKSATSVNPPADNPLAVIFTHLTHDQTPSSYFLDFLELSLGPDHYVQNLGNDFVDGLNIVLGQRGSPYLLTPYTYEQEESNEGSFQGLATATETSTYPKAYLKQSQVSQRYTIEPALELLNNKIFKVPNQDFRKALDKQRNGDFDGVLTSCVAALEGTIKASANTRAVKIKGNGLGGIFKSFASNTRTVPNQLKTVVDFLSERRSNVGDAHGHASKDPISEHEAAFFISLTAALLSFFVNSE